MRAALIISLLAISAPTWAAKSGRSLPRGEEFPRVITASYSSAQGELHFEKVSENSHSAMLRKPSGDLIGLQRIDGPSECHYWLISEKTDYPPTNCIFVFGSNPEDREMISVRGSDLRENSLFDTVSSRVRGANVAL